MKISLIKSGSGIVRQYKNNRNSLKLSSVSSGASFLVAGHALATSKPVEGTFFAGLVTMTMKNVEDALLAIKKLKPEYDAIVARAKRIYKK